MDVCPISSGFPAGWHKTKAVLYNATKAAGRGVKTGDITPAERSRDFIVEQIWSKWNGQLLDSSDLPDQAQCRLSLGDAQLLDHMDARYSRYQVFVFSCKLRPNRFQNIANIWSQKCLNYSQHNKQSKNHLFSDYFTSYLRSTFYFILIVCNRNI